MTAALQSTVLAGHHLIGTPTPSISTGVLTTPREATIHLHANISVVTTIADQYSPERAEMEAFVSMMFKRVHHATVTHFMPHLMGLRDASGKLLAVCGIRHAEHQPLFLEHYLDAPVEQVLSSRVGSQVARSSILEVGNLAVLAPETVRSLLASVSVYLHSTHSDWAVFTGITTLRNSLTKLNMPLQLLGEASINSLPVDERAAWGTYYDERPQVMAIRRMQ